MLSKSPTGRNAVCFLILTVAWVSFCWPWFFDGRIIPYDAKNHFYGMVRFVASAWHSGENPSWSPYHYGGFPMIADPQSVIWTPSMWLPVIISDKPSMRLVDAVHLAHLLIGALAIFAYGRLRKWRDEASLIAAICFMMSGPLAVRLEHLLMTVSTMWIAIALWRLEAAIQSGGVWRGLAFGASLGLLLIDRNHVAYLGALFLFFYWLSRFDLRTPFAVRRHGSVVIGGLFALLLAAVPLLLLFQLINQSNRPNFEYIEASWQSLPPPQMSSFLFPEYFGSFKKFGSHWGPASKTWGDFTLQIHRGMIYLYAGTLASLLILWIGIARRQLLTPGPRFLAIMAIVSLIYALGRYTPVFEVLYHWVPGVDLFRRPSDALFVFGVIISLLTGTLLDRALTMPRARLEKGPVIIALGLLVVAITPLYFISASFERVDELARDILVFVALSTGFAALIICARRSERWRALAMILVAVGVSADLIRHNSRTILSAWRPPHYQPMETPENDPFFSKVPALLAETDPSNAPWRVEFLGLGHTVQNVAQVSGVQNILGYNPIRLDAFERYIGPDMQNSAANTRKWGERMTGYNSTMTDRLGLRYIVTGRPIEEIDPTIDPDRFQLVDEVKRRRRTAFVYFNPNAQARASLVDHEGNPIEEGRVRFEQYAHTELRLNATAPKAGYLILAEFDYPGWYASVNGVDVPIERYQDMFRAIKVPAGDSNVVLTFNALSWQNLKGATQNILKRFGG